MNWFCDYKSNPLLLLVKVGCFCKILLFWSWKKYVIESYYSKRKKMKQSFFWKSIAATCMFFCDYYNIYFKISCKITFAIMKKYGEIKYLRKRKITALTCSIVFPSSFINRRAILSTERVNTACFSIGFEPETLAFLL